MIIQPIKYKKAYENVIANQIIIWLWANIFQEMFIILKNSQVANSGSVLLDEINAGNIFYQNGAFYSVKSKFSNRQSIELERIGARYSRARNAYVLASDKVPNEILWAIKTASSRTAGKVNAIKAFLTNQLVNLTELQKKLAFDEAVNTIMLDLQDRVYKNAEQHKIELITPKLDDFRAEQIAEKYTNNLNFWIKDWLPQDIIKMREAVGQMAIEGKSTKSISDYIAKRFGIDQRHARFLARNESAIATTSYLRAKYMAEGFTHFKWHTNIDGREREWHKKLGTVGEDGKGNIYRFDNPPIINEKTGQRGMPAEDYNCRCTFSPIANKEWIENRKKLYKVNNSLIEKIKEIYRNVKNGRRKKQFSP